MPGGSSRQEIFVERRGGGEGKSERLWSGGSSRREPLPREEEAGKEKVNGFLPGGNSGQESLPIEEEAEKEKVKRGEKRIGFARAGERSFLFFSGFCVSAWWLWRQK